MNNQVLDSNLITKFRNKVNSNSFFVLHKYKEIENKNRWNIICSCMDWISVSIKTIKFPDNDNKDFDKKTIDVYSYISSIDIIFNAINQLHRVLVNRKNIPFHGRKLFLKVIKLLKMIMNILSI